MTKVKDYPGIGRLHLIAQVFKSGELFQAVVRGRFDDGRRVTEMLRCWLRRWGERQ